jgi:hypothetical protein
VLELFEALVRVDPTSAADELPRILAHVEGAWPERVQLRQARIRVLGDARHLHDAGALDARGEALYLAAWLDTVAGAFELELASHASSGAFCLALLARDLANAAPPWRIEVLPGTGALVLDGGVEVPDPRDQIGERFPCDAGGCPLALARGSKTVAFAATIGVLDRKSGVELARRRVTTQAEPVPPSATAR